MKKSLKIVLISFIFSMTFLFANTPVNAETVMSKYASKFSKPSSYSQLPKEIQSMIPDAPPASPATWDVDLHGSYPAGQCTWYVYNRAKSRGIEYSPYEGNGGVWMLKVNPAGLDTGTEGDTKPVPQVAISMQGGYDGIDAKYTSPLKNIWFFTTHVAYSEYIDSEGYMLMSETNVDGTTRHVLYRIVTPDQAQKQNLFYVKPKNWKSLKDYGKNPDGTLPKDAVGGTATTDGATSDTNTTTKKRKISDNTFTVNGYGSLTSKDFQEANVTDYLPTQEDIDAMSDSQKQTLMEWIADYSNDSKASVLKITRVGMMLVGYSLVIFTILILLAYAFDRVGILEFSCVEMITGGNYTTTYTKEEAQELKHSNLGIKPMDLKSIIIITILCISVFVLIVSGKMYYYAYNLYSFIYNISEYMNNIRPK